jgi:cation diffusion facilitator CzcD-associated flavoprotein CzcO
LQGCASDVPIHGYSYSTDRKPDWLESHGKQPEILDYIKDVTAKYNLRPQIEFDTSVVKAEWDDIAQIWRVSTLHKPSGTETTQTASVVISAIGLLDQPHTASIPGAGDFKGELFHSAQYRHDIDLHGKRVAVIGNGCSATQIVPVISRDPTTDVTSFARTRMWYFPGQFTPYSPTWRWIYKNVPMMELLHRWRIQATVNKFQ